VKRKVFQPKGFPKRPKFVVYVTSKIIQFEGLIQHCSIEQIVFKRCMTSQ